MNNQLSIGNFYIIKSSNSSTRDLHTFYKIEAFSPVDTTEWQKENIVLYNTGISFNNDKLYSFELLQLPFTTRKLFTHIWSKNDFTQSAYNLFLEYCKIATITNNTLFNKYTDVYVFCSLLYNDYCILIPKELSHNFDAIKNEVMKTLIDTCFSLYNSPDSSYNDAITEADLENKKQRKIDCIRSGRQFVKHSPRFHLYKELIETLDNIPCDSLGRKQELSLFSSLVINDLIHETHLYWLHPTGDFHYELAEKTYCLNMQERLYFDLFSLFCKQAEDNNKYNDWCWVLTFLTQTLLSTINGRSKNGLQQEERDKYFNFFGFAPILLDLKEHGNEVTSLYPYHISAKFCHGFLVVPTASVYNIIANLPAYIHEFFHYIPPEDRAERNKTIVELFLHAIFYELRLKLDNDSYNKFFNSIKNEMLLSINKLGFTEKSFFTIDSMEFYSHFKSLFFYYTFEEMYKSAITKAKIDNTVAISDIILKQNMCVKKFDNVAHMYFNTFVLFFREIRSDIEMCNFLEINLEDYIRLLVNEPEFCILPKDQIGDSTIMRFGYMCHYLFFIGKNNGNDLNNRDLHKDDWYKDDWHQNVINTIKKLQNKANGELKQKYNNLIGYLDEYMDLAIERNNDAHSNEYCSILESNVNKLFGPTKQTSKHFEQSTFVQSLKKLYKEYKKASAEEKLQLICGIKILFRDLYAFDPDLDLAKT